MTLTVRLFGAEILHIEVADTDPPDGGGYDHDVVSVSLDADRDETGEALGFVSPGVEVG